MDHHNPVRFSYADFNEAFPDVDAGVKPLGSRVLVQLRRSKRKTRGGIILTENTQETETWNTQVGKVLAVGPVAFKDRRTLQPWGEGAWAEPGDFVRVPKYGGDRWTIDSPEGEAFGPIMFAIFNDTDIIGAITGDPLDVRAFI